MPSTEFCGSMARNPGDVPSLSCPGGLWDSQAPDSSSSHPSHFFLDCKAPFTPRAAHSCSLLSSSTPLLQAHVQSGPVEQSWVQAGTTGLGHGSGMWTRGLGDSPKPTLPAVRIHLTEPSSRALCTLGLPSAMPACKGTDPAGWSPKSPPPRQGQERVPQTQNHPVGPKHSFSECRGTHELPDKTPGKPRGPVGSLLWHPKTYIPGQAPEALGQADQDAPTGPLMSMEESRRVQSQDLGLSRTAD
ncbi:hypothetical protein AAY473_001758 [Plecturocebus cupreus]